MKVLQFIQDKSVEETLTTMIDRKERISEVMVISNNIDGTQYLMTSQSNGQEKAYMVTFAMAYMAQLQKYEVEA